VAWVKTACISSTCSSIWVNSSMCSDDVCSSSLWFSLMYKAWIPNIPPGLLLAHRMFSTRFLIKMHIFYQNTHSVHLLVRWCTSAAVDRLMTDQWICLSLQPATWELTPVWSPGRVGRKPAGFLMCGVALTAPFTAVVGRPWTSAAFAVARRWWLSPGTRSRWRWPADRCSPASGAASWTWASTPRSTLQKIYEEY